MYRVSWLSKCSAVGCLTLPKPTTHGKLKPISQLSSRAMEHTDCFFILSVRMPLTWAFCLFSLTLVSHSPFQEKCFSVLPGSEVCTPRHGLSFAVWALAKIIVTTMRWFTTNNPYIYYFNPKRKAQSGQYNRGSQDRLTLRQWSALPRASWGGEVKTRC